VLLAGSITQIEVVQRQGNIYLVNRDLPRKL